MLEDDPAKFEDLKLSQQSAVAVLRAGASSHFPITRESMTWSFDHKGVYLVLETGEDWTWRLQQWYIGPRGAIVQISDSWKRTAQKGQ